MSDCPTGPTNFDSTENMDLIVKRRCVNRILQTVLDIKNSKFFSIHEIEEVQMYHKCILGDVMTLIYIRFKILLSNPIYTCIVKPKTSKTILFSGKTHLCVQYSQ